MKLQTHISFGILLGVIFYAAFKIDFGFVFLIGVASFLPDIDWAMQFKYEMGNVHRTFLHNVWAMLIFAGIGALISSSVLVFLGIIIGFSCHMFLDSFTVTGVYWTWPYGDERITKDRKFFKSGKFNMSNPGEAKTERRFQILMLVIAGAIFLLGGISVNIYTLEGIITIILLITVGSVFMKKFRDAIVKVIRRIGI